MTWTPSVVMQTEAVVLVRVTADEGEPLNNSHSASASFFLASLRGAELGWNESSVDVSHEFKQKSVRSGLEETGGLRSKEGEQGQDQFCVKQGRRVHQHETHVSSFTPRPWGDARGTTSSVLCWTTAEVYPRGWHWASKAKKSRTLAESYKKHKAN